MLTFIAKLGFDLPRLAHTFRTGLAAAAAVLGAWFVGLEHPQWSGMTVWAASQPTRGQLLEKSLFRVIGTVIGVTYGVLLVMMAGTDQGVTVLGLALWITICVGLGNLQRGYFTYGSMLAGYSAAIVALLDTAHPELIWAIGVDRLITIMLGVVLGLIVGLLFTPSTAETAIVGRTRRVTARVLRTLSQSFSLPAGEHTIASYHDILAELAAIEGQLDPMGAGSLRSRRVTGAIRQVLIALTELLVLGRNSKTNQHSPELVLALEATALVMETEASNAEIGKALDRLVAKAAHYPAIIEALRNIRADMKRAQQPLQRSEKRKRDGRQRRVVLHREWDSAWRAMVRTFICLNTVGALWIVTGGEVFSHLLLGVSIMISLFSTFDNPSKTMRPVIVGQVYGLVGALIVRFVLWPFAPNEFVMVLFMLPLCLVAPLFFSHRKTLPNAFDFAMVSLLVLTPDFNEAEPLIEVISMGAIIFSPVIALLAFRYIFPVDADDRVKMLVALMANEVEDMAQPTAPTHHQPIWRARLNHRLLRLVRLTSASARTQKDALEAALATVVIGDAIAAIRAAQQSRYIDESLSRALTVSLNRLASFRDDPRKVANTLAQTATKLARVGHADAAILHSASQALLVNADHFGSRAVMDVKL